MTNHMDVRDWVQYGVDRGYAETYCYMHDSSPMTDQEEEDYVVNGEDPCIPTLRVWLDQEQNPLSSQFPNIQQQTLFQ